LKMDAADAIETSCSPDFPPKMTPIRSLFTRTNNRSAYAPSEPRRDKSSDA
jgi:hypothetical protein